jgi:CheY-like chemotaxis protein
MARPYRIIIVDDSDGDRNLMKEAIIDAGWNARIEEASSSRQAINVLRREATKGEVPDLILLDYLINGENCIDLIKAIRGMSGYGDIPIIVISTTTPPESNREQCYSLGVLKVIMRSFDNLSLLRTVKTLKKMLSGNGAISRGGSWISDADLSLLGDT